MATAEGRRYRSIRSGAGATALVGVLACSAAPHPGDAEIFRLVVASLREEVAAPSPLLLHPLLIRRDPGGRLRLDRATFNAFDSSAVPEVVERAGTELRLCNTNPAGSCEVPVGGVAVALSEAQDVGRNGVAVGAVVLDRREGRPPRQYFLVRVRARPGGWEVVEVRRVNPYASSVEVR